MKTYIALIFYIISLGILNVISYNITDYNQLINLLSTNVNFLKDFDENIERLLKMEPNYFHYTPFKGR